VVWARRFDRESDDLLTLQDEIAAEVVAQIDPEILMIESRRASHRPPHDASAYHLMLRAIPLMNRMDPVVFAQAGDLLRRAIALEPDYAAAHAWLAQWHIFLLGQGWADDAPEQMAEARRLAERAISLDPQDALGLTIAGHVRAFLNHRLREAIALHDRALTHNPNLSMAWALSAASSLYLGHLDDAERKLRRYKQLSPMDPHAFFYDTAFVMLALLRRDYETAAECGRAVSELNPAFSAVCKPYLAALGYLGLNPEAEAVKRRLLGIEPGFTVSGYVQSSAFMRSEDCWHVAEGLRLAGIPEGAPATVAGCV
jgi:tetratricopeptide (TPR) repeat protein